MKKKSMQIFGQKKGNFREKCCRENREEKDQRKPSTYQARKKAAKKNVSDPNIRREKSKKGGISLGLKQKVEKKKRRMQKKGNPNT